MGQDLLNTHLRRATCLAEYEEKSGRMFDPEAIAQALRFEPRSSDVIITPFAKCGTTWLQQIFHTLRTRGDEDYDDISRVVPWIETSVGLGLDLEALQRGTPRGFKSHLARDVIPKGGRYLVSMRDPKDALLSAYRFMNGWFIEPGSVSLDEFARHWFVERGETQDYWHHLAGWWEVRDDPDVLLLSYEQMIRDPEAAVRRVANFVGITLDGELLEITLNNSSLDYMLLNKDKFDDRMLRELSERVCGLPPGSDSAKVRKGQVGEHREHLSSGLIAELDAIWSERIGARFGYPDYEAMETALATRAAKISD